MAFNLSGLEDALGLIKKKPEDLMRTPPITPTMEGALPSVMPAIAGAPALPAAASPMKIPANAMGEAPPMTPQTATLDLSGRGVDLPDRAWSSGKTAYSPIAQAQDQFMQAGMTPGKDGKPAFKRSWKDALRNAGIGFLQGAASNPENPLGAGLGGAAAGGLITGASPMLGRQYRFNTMERPRIEAEQQQSQAYEDRMRKAAEAALAMRGLEARTSVDEFEARDRPGRVASEREYQDRKRIADAAQATADLEGTRARTDATRAGMKDSAQERAFRQAQIDRINAQTEAVKTGKPQQIEYVDPTTKKPVKALVYPDGRQEIVGGSLRAYVEDVKQSGANARASQAEGGRNARAAAKAAAKGPSVQGYVDHMKKKGVTITPDQARQALQSRGAIK